MSDYDEYGDAFDCLWIDFDEPHFTDEMTMMVNPDPVFLDDSSLEDAFETDTDWEYFSDEYYDHDNLTSEQGALVDDNLNLNNNMETDGLSRPVSGLKTFLLRSNMRAEKKGRDHLSMNNNGPQLRKGSSAREEAKPNNKLDIILPPAPENIEEYKDIITTAPPVTQKRGRKRKADVTVEQTTSGLDSSSGSGPIRSSKRKKAGHTNGVKTAASSRPTRSSTRRK
ncbi:hypothetical protein TEQG_04290 [Trichophyton equinum CBS 127.97]|uniref:Uncharacterized protein n=1 Tax=Trichophyton equinum (strain ATCC MYA-4606 / CBS 127.97) TaxID=559882 RepID=F2PU46_TRIEC|nr:hypothetical protein TEQG_04290 [Trichophyton equinum CBS 127.97]